MNQNNVKYLGLDVSKGYSDFCLLDSKKQVLEKDFQLDDNLKGHGLLSDYIEKHTQHGVKIICGIESTGGYEQNWLNLLKRLSKKHPVEVYKLNPKGVKHQIQSTLRRTITDGVSAQGIAEYVANNYQESQEKWKKSTDQSGEAAYARSLFRLIMGMIKHQTARYNQLEKLLYQNFPELLTFCKQGVPGWIIRLLIRYPGASAISRAHVEGLDSIKGISRIKAARLKQMAKESVSKSSHALGELVIKTLAEDIEHHENRIEDLKNHLCRLYKNDQTNLIKSIRGIGDWTATAIIMLLGDVRRFEGTDQIASFYGIHPIFKQSGDGKWGMRMSKQGNSAMRSILFIAANNVVLHEPYFKSLYHRHASKGKKRRAIIGIIMHKLLRIIYGLLKNNTPFDSKVDEGNQSKAQPGQNEQINVKARRYQEITVEAPVSRSNYKKRRAVLERQISTEDINTASSLTALFQK